MSQGKAEGRDGAAGSGRESIPSGQNETRIPLPALLRPRLQAYRVGDAVESDVVLRDPRSGEEHWLKGEQFWLLEVLPDHSSYEALADGFRTRFGRDMDRDEVDRVLGNVANLKLVTRTSEQHPLLARHFQDPPVGDSPAAPAAAPGPAAPPSPERPERGGVRDVLGIDETVKRISFSLFDPRPLLQRVLPAVRPLRHAVYAVPILLLAATGVCLRYSGLIQQDLTRLLGGISLIEHLLLGLVTVNLLVTVCTALVAQQFRATVSSIDLVLALGFVPRLVPRIGHVDPLRKAELLWLHAAPLITRLCLFSLAVLLWYAERAANGSLATFGLGLAVVCAASFFFSANPLAKGSGYQLLATLLEEPNLRGKSLTALLSVVRGRRHQVAGSEALAAYALTSAAFMVVAVIFLVQILAQWLEFQLGAGGVLIIVALTGFLLARTASKLRRIAQSLERAEQLDRWRNRTLHKRHEGDAEKPSSTPRSYALRVAVVGFIVVLFLPYPYEPSGEFVIVSAERQAITSDVAGTIERVYYDGGERLRKGTVVAELAHHVDEAEMNSAAKRMAEHQALVDELRARPRPEEVELARSGVMVAEIRAEFSKAEHLRLKSLYENRAGSLEEVEAARRQAEVDVARIDEEKAEFALVMAGAPRDEIRAIEAKVGRWRVERDAYRDRVERAKLRMPFDGQLVTLRLKQRTGEFLEPGGAYAEAENNREVLALIEIPESDIAHIEQGGEVELRTWAHHHEPIRGEVVEIEANVVEEQIGKFVTVVSRFDNADGRLKTGMTGYAKIEGNDQPVWRVFTRALTRFFFVEAWSWVP